MRHIDPATYKVTVRRADDGRLVALFTSHDPADAARYVTAVQAAHPGWVGSVDPVPQSPIADALREVA